MSNNKNQRPLFVRILAGILAGLLILSTIIIAIEMIFDASAETAEEISELESLAFSSTRTSEEFYIAVSLKYGSSMKASYGVFSPFGFAVGEADVQKDSRRFDPVWLCDENSIVVAIDSNLNISSTFECTETENTDETHVGGYNVEVVIDPDYVSPIPEDSSASPVTESTETCTWDCLNDLSDAYIETYRHVFRAYINGEKTIRIGAFATYTEASVAAGAISATLEGFKVSVASPSAEGAMILNEDCSTIIFEYSKSDRILAVCARQYEGEERTYSCIDSNKIYDGAMCFRRMTYSDTHGLLLSNLVALQQYIEGVIPAEVYTSWPLETLKAFGVAANTFVIDNIGYRMKTDYTDVRASSSDQNYGGREGVTTKVVQAAEYACKWAIAYTDASGKTSIITCAYSSSNGGTTIDSKYAWNASVGPYIASHLTMWEDYYNGAGAYGFWTREVTPTELCTQLKASGVKLTGTKVTNVSYETTGDSSYVYSITFTDDNGTSATVTKTQKVMGAFGGWCHSANFVIAQGTLDYSYDDVLSNRIISLTDTYSGELNVKTSNGSFPVLTSLFNFLTGQGKADNDTSNALYVKTADGNAILVDQNEIPVTSFPDETGKYTYVSDFGDFLVVSELQHYDVSWTASSPENYLIAGKGFGHGVGMSQYGARHLGSAGATADQIIRAYFLETHLVDFNEWRRTH